MCFCFLAETSTDRWVTAFLDAPFCGPAFEGPSQTLQHPYHHSKQNNYIVDTLPLLSTGFHPPVDTTRGSNGFIYHLSLLCSQTHKWCLTAQKSFSKLPLLFFCTAKSTPYTSHTPLSRPWLALHLMVPSPLCHLCMQVPWVTGTFLSSQE